MAYIHVLFNCEKSGIFLSEVTENLQHSLIRLTSSANGLERAAVPQFWVLTLRLDAAIGSSPSVVGPRWVLGGNRVQRPCVCT